MNTPAKINVPEGQLTNTIANQSKTHLKRRRLVGAKDTAPWKRRLQELNKKTLEESKKQKR